jgi:hypothetical protein
VSESLGPGIQESRKNEGEGMTAPMIEWTLEVLEWIRGELWEKWPEAKLRGSAPELSPEGYKIRFRDRGRQFWLYLTPQVMLAAPVYAVTSLLGSSDWIRRLQESGQISVELHDRRVGVPVLHVPEGVGPELHAHFH